LGEQVTAGLNLRYFEYAKTDVGSILEELKSSEDGLSDAEALARAREHGYNDPISATRDLR